MADKPMRDYTYVSPTKTEMLYGQLPNDRRERISAEFGINLGVFAAKVGSQVPEAEGTVARARIVAEALRKEGVVGDLTTDAEWIEDTMSVRSVSLEGNPSIFLLIGNPARGPVLLAGSAAHLISGVPTETVKLGYSYLPYLAESLVQSLESIDEETEGMKQLRKELYGSSRRNISALSDSDLARVVDHLVRYPEGMSVNVGFFARKLWEGRSEWQTDCTILSPLYVYSL